MLFEQWLLNESSDYQALFSKMLDNRLNSLQKLVIADYLDDHNKNDLASFIRLNVELTKGINNKEFVEEYTILKGLLNSKFGNNFGRHHNYNGKIYHLKGKQFSVSEGNKFKNISIDSVPEEVLDYYLFTMLNEVGIHNHLNLDYEQEFCSFRDTLLYGFDEVNDSHMSNICVKHLQKFYNFINDLDKNIIKSINKTQCFKGVLSGLELLRTREFTDGPNYRNVVSTIRRLINQIEAKLR